MTNGEGPSSAQLPVSAGKCHELRAEVAIDFCENSPLLQKQALRKPVPQMHVVLVINDCSILVYPAFSRTIILTVLPLRELLLMVNKSSNDVEFLNEDDGSMVPPRCHYAVVAKITVKGFFFF